MVEKVWNSADLPNRNTKSNRLCRLMNDFGRLPFPFKIIAKQLRQLLLKELKKGDVQIIHVDYGFNLLFGNLSGGPVYFSDTMLLDYEFVTFGANVLIGPACKIITSWHTENNIHEIRAKPVSIGNNVWLTMNIIVLPGVSIGDNTIIGAGSIVTRSIPSNVIAAGNPAKVIREIKL